MDDYIPCKWNKPVFTRANGNELWVLFLEKAWAKIHGSYDRIKWGQAHLTMRDLTGAPGYQYVIETEKDMFEKIVDADAKEYLISISCGKSDLEK
jgi:calpain-15